MIRKQGFFWLGLAGLLVTRIALAWNPADQHDMGLIEQRLFQQTYETDAPAVRVNRAENTVYGQIKPGTPEARLSALRKTLPPMTTGPVNSPPSQAVRQPAAVASPVAKHAEESDYPIVDELERRVLTQTFPKEDLSVRVPRLEARVFGQPQQGDWSNRVDALHDKVLGRGKAVPNPNDDPDTMVSNTAPPDFNVSPEQVAPVITQMEQQIFRQTYANEPVESRLNRLETKLFAKTAPPDLTPEERVERIVTVAGAGGERPTQTRSTAANIAIQLAPILIMMLPLVI
jgi:hypothetical protein